jgi:hypothetical protein
MPSLYIVRAQPNPRGKDTTRSGYVTNEKLNEEWIEFEAREVRNLVGDVLSHLTFTGSCQQTGADTLINFGSGQLLVGQRVRVHTGRGTNQWVGSVYHMYLNRGWFVWNNACGDRATLSHQSTIIDWARYRPNPPEGELVRSVGTEWLEPAGRAGLAWR